MTRHAAAVLAVFALLGVAGCTSGEGPTGAATRHGSSQSPASAGRSPSPAPSAVPTGIRPTRVRATQTSWRLPQPMSRGVAVPVPGGAVLAGGLLSGDVTTDRAYRITLPAGHVKPLPPLGTAAHDAAGAVLRGQPAVFGGGGSTELAVVQRLGRGGAWHVVGRLPGARSDLAAVGYAGGAVVLGGYDGTRSPRSILRTHDGRRFTAVGRLPQGIRYAAVVVIGDLAWVVGGEKDHRELSAVYAVDLRSGHVRPAGRLPQGLGHAAAAVVGDRVLVMGGRTTPDQPTDAMWWFQPSTGSWRRAGRLPYPVADAPTVVTADAAYLLGGEAPDFTDRVTRVSWH